MYGMAVGSDGSTRVLYGKQPETLPGRARPARRTEDGPAIDLSANGRRSTRWALLSPRWKACPGRPFRRQRTGGGRSAGRQRDWPGSLLAFAPTASCWTPDGKTALVSNFGGGRRPPGRSRRRNRPARDVAVDERSVALRGSVSVIDVESRKVVAEIATRIHPEAMMLSPDGKRAYVVDAERRRRECDRRRAAGRGRANGHASRGPICPTAA